MSVAIFEDRIWQMSLGERAGVEGVLSQLRPALAVEIGSAQGASLLRIAAHAQEVHSFDLDPPSLPMPANVTLHSGDSHELLPAFLAQLAEQGRNVDFVLVDGDHSPAGVRQDIEDLLDSPALARSVILIHDAANERVREGVDGVHFKAWPKVAHVELDWIPGRLFAEPALRNELWYGIALVLVDVARTAYLSGAIYEDRYHPAGPLLARVRDLVVARERVPAGADGVQDLLDAERERARTLEGEVVALRRRAARLEAELGAARQREATLEDELAVAQQRIARADRTLSDVTGSASWRMTGPLRGAKRRAGRPKG